MKMKWELSDETLEELAQENPPEWSLMPYNTHIHKDT